MLLGRDLRVTGAHLVEVRVVDGRLPAEVALRPDEYPLRAHLDVDARVVEVEGAPQQLRRMHLHRGWELGGRLAHVALGVRLQVPVVDGGRPLDEQPDPALDSRPGGVREEQRDARVPGRLIGLLRVAEAGGDVDCRGALGVIGGDRPGDGLLGGVDRGQLTGDEPLERVAYLLGQGAGHCGEVLREAGR
jgi:hypothetical protein